ncbi:hypothetical protein [Maricaulis sp.]|uniref:hypothetical protein n=1 Tax=Maricaulis sp. TaxID=1486257 RepID=UPI003A9199FE
MKLIHASAALGLISLAACSAPQSTPASDDMLLALSQYCGQAFEGGVVSDDPRDADWAAEVLTIHFRECSEDEVRIPLHVGENRSRTWIISRQGDGLRLQHDHRHEDGSDDAVSMYGGSTVTPPADGIAQFPADQFSKDLFEREGLAVSVTNVWTLALTDEALTYALDRPERHFEVSFDLTRPVDVPPAPWGFE